MSDLRRFLNDEDEDKILAQVLEESWSHSNAKKARLDEDDDDIVNIDDIITIEDSNSPNEVPVPDALCTQVGGKAGEVLHDGDEANGFHLAAGSTYIYPTNYPVRQYQSNIVRTALFKNTLVTLPTGLGKTFIAAVVMYNFYRWYPCGKVVFMAPTRPLVAQQIKACHNIMNIPPSDTTEMTGLQNTELRQTLWKEKRVFFLTPQVLVNDLRSSTCPAELIKCVVVDEAHRAVKDYAYCQVIKFLQMVQKSEYRVLALSATPGNDINAVQQVIQNLQITALEIRAEESLDVAPYSHSRAIDNMVVSPSVEMLKVREDFLKVYDKYARRLKEFRALSSNIATLSKFQVLKALEKFRANPPRGLNPSTMGSLVCDFTVCMSLAHALELLQIYGLRAFYTYLSDENSEKCKAASTRLKNDEDLKKLLRKLKGALYTNSTQNLPYIWGHPKLQKLVESLTEHFAKAEEKRQETKAIIFCQYRVVVSEIVALLEKSKPRIRSAIFVGQSGGKEKGMNQAKQLEIMKKFREGQINCLVATCVAEEGLDIGEVDLIVLMEVQKSLVRFVQRIGRTGRKRKGRCIVLLTKGKEEQKFHEAMAIRKSYVSNIANSKAIQSSLLQFSPSMFPPDVKPTQQLVHISVPKAEPTPEKKQAKKQTDIRSCMTVQESPFLTEEEFNEVVQELGSSSVKMDLIPERKEVWHRRFGDKMSFDEVLNNKSRLYFWNDWNLETHRSFSVSNSLRSQQFCELLQLAQKRENWVNFTDEELDKLIMDDLGEKSKNKEDKSVPDEPKQPEKKAKKAKLDPAKGHMDIRSCMAVAAQKAAKAPEMEPIEIDDFPPDLVSETNLEQIYSQVLTCAYEKNIEMGYRIEKYMTPKPLFPIQIPKFDTNLNVEFLFKTDFIQNLNIGVFSTLDNTELLSQTPKFPPEEFRPEINNLFDDSDGFNIDDLLYDEKVHTDSKNNQQKTNLDKLHNLSPDIVCNDLIEDEMPHNSNLKDEFHNDVKELSPDIVGIDDLIEDEMPHNSNSKLKDELHNDGKELSPDIVCIDDLIEDDISNNSLKDKHNDFKELSPDIVCIDDLFNESENSPKPEDKFESFKNQLASPKNKFEMAVENLLESKKEQKHSDSKSFIVSSTPKPSNIGKTFKKNTLPKAQSEELDLFEDDDVFKMVEMPTQSTMMSVTQLTSLIMKDKEKPKSPNESTMLGLTQMTEMIMKDKNPSQNKPKSEPSCSLVIQNAIDLPEDVKTSIEDKPKDPVKRKFFRSHLLSPSPSPVKSIKSKDLKENIFDLRSPERSKSHLLSSSPSPSPVKAVKHRKKTKKKANVFIENEAEESGLMSSDDSDNSSLDQLDNSFIDDETQADLTHALYMKSVRSPKLGKFKIPSHCNNAVDVFSQQVEQDSEYQKDSFCVDTDEEEAPPELSLLEIAERKLAKKRKKRILEPSSSSSKSSSKEDFKTPEFIPKRRRIESDTDNDTPKAKKRLDYPIFSKSKKDPVIVLDDSDEEFQEALKLSQKETTIDPEALFEEDLKKAIRLSQMEAERPSFQNLPSTSSTVYHPQTGTLSNYFNPKPSISTKNFKKQKKNL